MKLSNIIILSILGVLNVSLAIPAVVNTAVGLTSNNTTEVEIEEDLTGVTSAKIVKNPNKTVYQEDEYYDTEGMMCLITQNGIKKMVKDNFEVVDPKPLKPSDTSVKVRYGDFEFDAPCKVIQFVSVLDITHNGTYVVEAEDPRIPLDGYIEADPAWSAAHYDGVNEVTKFVEPWENSRTIPSKGNSLANIAVGSVLGFKFTVLKDCVVTFSAKMAMYDTKKPSDLLSFRLDGELREEVDKNLVLTHLSAEDAGAKYFNWQNWNMGTYPLTAGNHVFTITVDDFKLPNLDLFTLTATDMEGGDAINITNNGTYSLLAADPVLDRSTWVKDNENFSYDETWTNSGATEVSETTGQSIGHLANGAQIIVPIGLMGRGKVSINLYVAHIQNEKPVSDYLKTKVDNTSLNKEDFGQDTSLKLGTSSVSTYWNWKKWHAGTIDLTKGSHILNISVAISLNIYKIEVTVTNFENGEYGTATIKGNETKIVEAESGLLDRTYWSIRSDFIQAGRDPVETWNTSSPTTLSNTSGRSLCGLNSGCEITLPFESNGKCNLAFQIVCAYSAESIIADKFSVTLNGEELTNNDTSLSTGAGSQTGNGIYFNWKLWNGGNKDITSGRHTIVVKLVNATINIDSFRFVSTNYSN